MSAKSGNRWLVGGLILLLLIFFWWLFSTISEIKAGGKENADRIQKLETKVDKSSSEFTNAFKKLELLVEMLVTSAEQQKTESKSIRREIKKTIKGHEKKLHSENSGASNNHTTGGGAGPKLAAGGDEPKAVTRPAAAPALQEGTVCFAGDHQGRHEIVDGQMRCVWRDELTWVDKPAQAQTKDPDTVPVRYREPVREEYYEEEQEASSDDSSWVPWAVGAVVLGVAYSIFNNNNNSAPPAHAVVRGAPADTAP